MNTVNEIVEILIKENVIDENNRDKEIEEFDRAVDNGTAYHICIDGENIGFIKFLKVKSGNLNGIYIDRFFVHEKYRGNNNLHLLRHYLPKWDFIYWYSQKHDKFIYKIRRRNGR